MEKEALINIILNDLDEMHTLVSTFKGKQSLNPAFIKLAQTKLNNIGEELHLLTLMDDETMTVTPDESSLTSSASTIPDHGDEVLMAESSNRFATGEATLDPAGAPEAETPIGRNNETPREISVERAEPSSVVPEATVQPLPESPEERHTPPKNEPLNSTQAFDTSPTDAPSVNERMAIKVENTHIKQIGKPVDDIRKAFGINDRFYFQRELFEGKAELFNQTLDQLNSMDSYDSALHFLQANFNWEDDNEAAQSFTKNIQRRYI